MGHLRYWQDKYKEKLIKVHGTHWRKAFNDIMQKTRTLKASLKKRSRDSDVFCNITITDLREMILEVYGTKCNYCKLFLNKKNMVCDHIIPIFNKGESTKENLQFICARCNTRKGPLTDEEYVFVLNWVKQQPANVRDYILRKLSRGDVFR